MHVLGLCIGVCRLRVESANWAAEMAVDLCLTHFQFTGMINESDGANMASLSPRAVFSFVSCPSCAVDCILYVLCAENGVCERVDSTSHRPWNQMSAVSPRFSLGAPEMAHC